MIRDNRKDKDSIVEVGSIIIRAVKGHFEVTYANSTVLAAEEVTVICDELDDCYEAVVDIFNDKAAGYVPFE